MTRRHVLVIATWVLTVFILYFGFDTKSPTQEADSKSRILTGTQLDVQPMIMTAKESLAVSDLTEIQRLEALAEGGDSTQQIVALKELSGKWYRLEEYYIAGHFAERVAEQEMTGQSWSIAGTTFMAGLSSSDAMLRDACTQKAIQALENAISLEPENVEYRVNLSLAYTENPPPNEPMKGIQMLLSLNEKHPENVMVLTTLARLAIKTGQYDRAQTRLERALEIEPNHASATCLLATVLEQTGDGTRAQELRNKCELLTLKE